MKTFLTFVSTALLFGVVFSVVTSYQTKKQLYAEFGAFTEETADTFNDALEYLRGVTGIAPSEDRTLGGVTAYDILRYSGHSATGTSDHGNIIIELENRSGKDRRAWYNNTNRTIYVNTHNVLLMAEPAPGFSSASSSMRVFVGTSTSADFANNTGVRMDNLQPETTFSRAILDGFFFATGTSATSTTAITTRYLPNDSYGSTSADETGAEGDAVSLVPVRHGEYIVFLKKQDTWAPCTGSATGDFCETATSTNWGLDLRLEVGYTATSTLGF